VDRIVEKHWDQEVPDLVRTVDHQAQGLHLGSQAPCATFNTPSSRPRYDHPAEATRGRSVAAPPDLVDPDQATVGNPHGVLVAHQGVRMLDH
jgi:hypothetical protein